MLDNLTYTAKSKLLELVNSNNYIGLKLEMGNGLPISILPITDINQSLQNSVMINKTPMVFVDNKDFYKLKKISINFDYITEEFIIGNKNVISS